MAAQTCVCRAIGPSQCGPWTQEPEARRPQRVTADEGSEREEGSVCARTRTAVTGHTHPSGIEWEHCLALRDEYTSSSYMHIHTTHSPSLYTRWESFVTYL